MAAVPALAVLGLTAVTMTASASTASPVAPAAQVAQSAPNYLANHANPVQEIAGDCAEITDNGGAGWHILSHGTGEVPVTVEGSGNCDVAIYPDSTAWGTAYEYENQSGNCLGVDLDTTAVTTSSGCSNGNGFEEWIGFKETDASGHSGWNLECIAENDLCAINDAPICADGTAAGSEVSVILTAINYESDTCVWTVP
jgi:opacity protein-like surface antigen